MSVISMKQLLEAGKERITLYAYTKKRYGKQHCANVFVVTGQVDRASYRYEYACANT